MVILLVRFEVFGEPVDALSDERNLDLGRARVALVDAIGRDGLSLDGFLNQTVILPKLS